MKSIDLNCDMGELSGAIYDGTQEALMPSLTSINVACGGHAGDTLTMETTIRQAIPWNLAVGAHPGYPDRANFGRIALNLSLEDVADSVFDQVRTLNGVADRCGLRLTHVKPHGALYNQAARNFHLASAIAKGVARWDRNVVLVGLAGAAMLKAFEDCGFQVAAEAFVDRRYEPDGNLRSREFGDALILEPEEAARQALSMVQRGRVMTSDGCEIDVNAQTLCIHGDTPGSAQIAATVATCLSRAGITLRYFASDRTR